MTLEVYRFFPGTGRRSGVWGPERYNTKYNMKVIATFLYTMPPNCASLCFLFCFCTYFSQQHHIEDSYLLLFSCLLVVRKRTSGMSCINMKRLVSNRNEQIS